MRIRDRIYALALIVGYITLLAPAQASTFRPVSLARLVERSDSIVVATPVAFECRSALAGKNQQLVTDVTLEVHWTLKGADLTGSDIIVRTLGGTADGVARIVYGEARLSIGQTSLIFLNHGRDGEFHVLEMAQGHYPVRADKNGEWRVNPSQGLEGVIEPQLSAAAMLVGKRLTDVPQLLVSAQVAP
jgi:hypothetical protein